MYAGLIWANFEQRYSTVTCVFVRHVHGPVVGRFTYSEVSTYTGGDASFWVSGSGRSESPVVNHSSEYNGALWMSVPQMSYSVRQGPLSLHGLFKWWNMRGSSDKCTVVIVRLTL